MFCLPVFFSPDSCRSLDLANYVNGPNTGVDNDDTIKVYRSGGADPEGGQSGDLYVTIKVMLFFM